MIPESAGFAYTFLQDHAQLLQTLSIIIFATGLFQNLLYIIELPAAWLELRRHSQVEDFDSPWQLLISDVAMPVSLLAPAYNEEAGIVQSVQSMLALQYSDFEVVVINDGSKDKTLDRLIQAFDLIPVTRACEQAIPHERIRNAYGSKSFPRLLVIDKENGGKADALNAGINFARSPLFCVMDGDSLLEPSVLLRVVRPFMEDADRMVAVGGTIRIVNGCEVKNGRILRFALPRRFLPLVQTMEYVRAFLMSRLAMSRWGILTIISGAFGIFRRNAALEVGGFTRGLVGEDMELVIKIHRYHRERKKAYQMRYVPEPVCWTEAPETIEMLGKQRRRWHRGLLESFFIHFRLLLNPAYGRIGLASFGIMLVMDVLGPLLEIAGYILIPLFYFGGILSLSFLKAYLAVTFIFGIFISITSLILEESELHRVPTAKDLALLALIAVAENFGYRQFNNIWRMAGWWEYVCGATHWGEMKRKGFMAPEVKKFLKPQASVSK
ncbi:MAG: glycosyltransferase [Bdellovibrionales bacterium]